MSLNLNYRSILKSTNAAAVPLYLGKNSKMFTKWLGIAAELSYNPHLRNGWVTVDTGVKGKSGSPLIEFSTWEANNSTYNIILPNAFAYKFLVSANGVVAQFLTRSSAEARELWVPNFLEKSVVNSWGIRSLSPALTRLMGFAPRVSIFYLTQKWGSALFSARITGAAQLLPQRLNLSKGLIVSDFFRRDLSSSFLAFRRAVSHRQYRIRFSLYERLATSQGFSGSFEKLNTALFIRTFFFTNLLHKFNLLSQSNSSDNPQFFFRKTQSTRNTFLSLLTKLNVLTLVFSEFRVITGFLNIFTRLLSGVIEDLVLIYCGAKHLSAGNLNSDQSTGITRYLTSRFVRLAQMTALSGISFIALVLFATKTLVCVFGKSQLNNKNCVNQSLILYAYKFRQLHLKQSTDDTRTSLANSVFLSSHLSTNNFLTTYSCHRGNRLRLPRDSAKFKMRRNRQFYFRRRRKSQWSVNRRGSDANGVRLLFRKRWKRLLKYFKISSANAQFNFVFFWSFHFFNFTKLQLGYSRFFYLAIRVIYFFRQFFKFFKFYAFYFRLLRSLEFSSGVLYSGECLAFNNTKLYSLLLFKKFGRVLRSFHSFCAKLFLFRWKNLSIGVVKTFCRARGVIMVNKMLRVANLNTFKSLRPARTATQVKLLGRVPAMLSPVSSQISARILNNSRSYLRYLLNFRKQVFALWKNKFLTHLGHLGATQLDYVLCGTTSNYRLNFLRFLLTNRFVGPRLQFALRTSDWVRNIVTMRGSRRMCFIRKLVLAVRARRMLALRAVKTQARKFLKFALPVSAIKPYLSFISRVRKLDRGARGLPAGHLIKFIKSVVSGGVVKMYNLLRVKKHLLTLKHKESALGLGAYNKLLFRGLQNQPYYCVEGLTSAFSCFSRPQLAISAANSSNLRKLTTLSAIKQILTLVTTAKPRVVTCSVGNRVNAASGVGLFFRSQILREFYPVSGAIFSADLTVDSRAHAFEFFGWANSQYFRVYRGVDFCSFIIPRRTNISALYGLLHFVGTPLGLLASMFTQAFTFMVAAFWSTLVSRFLCVNFFVAVNFGINHKLYSNTFFKNSEILFKKNINYGVFSSVPNLKRYLRGSVSLFVVGAAPFFRWIQKYKCTLLKTRSFFATDLAERLNLRDNATMSCVEFSSFGGTDVFNFFVATKFDFGAITANRHVFMRRHGVARFSRRFRFRRRAASFASRGLRVTQKNWLKQATFGKSRFRYLGRLLNLKGLSSLRFWTATYHTSSAILSGKISRFLLLYRLRMVGFARFWETFFKSKSQRCFTANLNLLGLRSTAVAFGRSASTSFLKQLLRITGLTYFQLALRTSNKLTMSRYARDSQRFLLGVRGIRPLKLFAHAKRIGLWPKNLKLHPIRARKKQPAFKLITYRHSRAALLKSNKVKMPPSIFSRENYDSMNLVWDFPRQNYRFARVNTFQRIRAWKYTRRQLVRRLFNVIFKKFRIRSYKRTFRYRKCLRRRWFRIKLKRRVIQGFARAVSRLSGVFDMRAVYRAGRLLKKFNTFVFCGHSIQLTYALVLKTFVASLYNKFVNLRRLSKVYFFKITKLQFLFLVVREFFLKMLTFFSNYAVAQKLIFDEFLSTAKLFSDFGVFFIKSLSWYHIKPSIVCSITNQHLLHSLMRGTYVGFRFRSDFSIFPHQTDKALEWSYEYPTIFFSTSAFVSLIFAVVNLATKFSQYFSQAGADASLVDELFESTGFTLLRLTRRRTRKLTKNITLTRDSPFLKPTRSMRILRLISRRRLLVRTRTHLKSRLRKLLKSWKLGRFFSARSKIGVRRETMRLRLIYLQLFWYLRRRSHYVNLARILTTASRIVRRRHQRSLLVHSAELIKSYTTPIWTNFRKRRKFAPWVRYWRRKKIRRKLRLIRRVRRKALPIVARVRLKKKWRPRRLPLFWNRRVAASRRWLFILNNRTSRRSRSLFSRFGRFGNLNFKSVTSLASGYIRLGRTTKFRFRRRIRRTNMVPAYLLRRERMKPKKRFRKTRGSRPRSNLSGRTRLVRQEIKSKKLWLKSKGARITRRRFTRRY